MRAMTDASRVAGLPWKSWTWSVSSSTRSSSIASRSAGATGTTKGSSPASSASSRSRRAPKPCTVWTASSSKPRSSSSSTPVRSASAAASEAVRARTCSGASPPAEASHAWRASSARVLPVPAAPTTSSGPPRCAATSRCAGVRPSSGSGTPLGYGRARSCSPQLAVTISAPRSSGGPTRPPSIGISGMSVSWTKRSHTSLDSYIGGDEEPAVRRPRGVEATRGACRPRRRSRPRRSPGTPPRCRPARSASADRPSWCPFGDVGRTGRPTVSDPAHRGRARAAPSLV